MSIVIELLLKEEQSLLDKLEEVRSELINHGYNGNSSPGKENTTTSTAQNDDFIDADEVQKFSTPQKMLYALKKNRRFMKIREIAQYICDITGEDVNQLTTQLSRRTSSLKEKGKITKYQYGTRLRDSFWGSPKWLDE